MALANFRGWAGKEILALVPGIPNNFRVAGPEAGEKGLVAKLWRGWLKRRYTKQQPGMETVPWHAACLPHISRYFPLALFTPVCNETTTPRNPRRSLRSSGSVEGRPYTGIRKKSNVQRERCE
jgi:hypothetical protein